jgi:hypothetical protein
VAVGCEWWRKVGCGLAKGWWWVIDDGGGLAVGCEWLLVVAVGRLL